MNWQEAGEEQGAGAPPDNPSIPPTFRLPIWLEVFVYSLVCGCEFVFLLFVLTIYSILYIEEGI